MDECASDTSPTRLVNADEPPPVNFVSMEMASSACALPARKKVLKKTQSKGTATQTTRIRSVSLSQSFRKLYFPGVTRAEWNDWRWQLRHRIRTQEQLEVIVDLSFDERAALNRKGSMLPLSITPYYMSLVSRFDPGQPIRRTVIPVQREFLRLPGEADDPLGEEGHSPVPGLVHRYPDRVLFLMHDICTAYCRYCTRSRVVGHSALTSNRKRLEAGLDYIRDNPAIRDVLLSGGDPLIMSDEKLEWILGRLKEIRHVEFVRIGTKVPVVLPQRITPELTRILRRYHPLWMSLHFIHPDECTPETERACKRLADAGIPLGSQTVLLRNVNDNVETIRQLVHRLLMMRVRPYYLYQCDPISGSGHFRTPVEKGLEILSGLRGYTSGYAIPTFVIDAPGGGGKIPLQPEYYLGRDGNDLLLRNYEGKIFRYPLSPLPGDPEEILGESDAP
ncbi:MAG: KamA family radical SAM protein [Planctomycetota bacterium]